MGDFLFFFAVVLFRGVYYEWPQKMTENVWVRNLKFCLFSGLVLVVLRFVGAVLYFPLFFLLGSLMLPAGSFIYFIGVSILIASVMSDFFYYDINFDFQNPKTIKLVKGNLLGYFGFWLGFYIWYNYLETYF